MTSASASTRSDTVPGRAGCAAEASGARAGSSRPPLAGRIVDLWSSELKLRERQAQVQQRAVEFAEVQEDHQLHFAKRDEELLAASQGHGFKVTWVILGLFGAVLLAILGMAFFGSEEQRSVAMGLGRGGLLLINRT